MIHRVMWFNKKTKEIITEIQFWKVSIDDDNLLDFFKGLADLESSPSIDNETPLFVDEGRHRVYHASMMGGDHLLTFWTDGKDEDRVISSKLRNAVDNITQVVLESDINTVINSLRNVLDDTVFTKFKVSFVGSGGVGKTTLFKLLFGKKFSSGYSPSPGVTISGDTFDFGTFNIHLWDFPGQVVFQDQWDFFLRGTDAIFLVSDSSFINVIKTKGLMKKIKNDAPAVPLFIVANKQDLMESMEARKIQRLLGQKTIPMIAAPSKENRDEQREFFLDILLEIACKSVGIEKPDVPVKDIILVSGEEVVPFDDEDKIDELAWEATDNKPISFILLRKKEDLRELIGWIPYEENQKISELIDLITALDRKDTLNTLEYQGGRIHLETSEHFDALFVVNNNQNEAMYRETLNRVITAMEISIMDNAAEELLEQYMLECLFDIPVAAINENHILESTGETLFGFENSSLNQLIEQVAERFSTKRRVGDVANMSNIPRVAFYGMVQLLIHIGNLSYAEL